MFPVSLTNGCVKLLEYFVQGLCLVFFNALVIAFCTLLGVLVPCFSLFLRYLQEA